MSLFVPLSVLSTYKYLILSSSFDKLYLYFILVLTSLYSILFSSTSDTSSSSLLRIPCIHKVCILSPPLPLAFLLVLFSHHESPSSLHHRPSFSGVLSLLRKIKNEIEVDYVLSGRRELVCSFRSVCVILDHNCCLWQSYDSATHSSIKGVT